MTSVDLRPARRLTIRCPVDSETFRLMAEGQAEAAGRDAVLGPILALIRSENPLGDFGIYTGVVEIGLGFESFIPTALADPALGAPGQLSSVPTVTLFTYIRHDADERAVMEALAALISLHPWEVPVIELEAIDLLVRR